MESLFRARLGGPGSRPRWVLVTTVLAGVILLLQGCEGKKPPPAANSRSGETLPDPSGSPGGKSPNLEDWKVGDRKSLALHYASLEQVVLQIEVSEASDPTGVKRYDRWVLDMNVEHRPPQATESCPPHDRVPKFVVSAGRGMEGAPERKKSVEATPGLIETRKYSIEMGPAERWFICQDRAIVANYAAANPNLALKEGLSLIKADLAASFKKICEDAKHILSERK